MEVRARECHRPPPPTHARLLLVDAARNEFLGAAALVLELVQPARVAQNVVESRLQPRLPPHARRVRPALCMYVSVRVSDSVRVSECMCMGGCVGMAPSTARGALYRTLLSVASSRDCRHTLVEFVPHCE